MNWTAAGFALAWVLVATPSTAEEPPAHVHSDAVTGEAPLADRSVYQLDGVWTDAHGQPFRLLQLRGKPVLALLFYGTCQSACPILVRDLQRVDALLPPADRQAVQYLLVSFDPAVDTPERLSAYAKEHGLEDGRWTLLNGTPEQVRALAAVLGVRYRATGDGQFSHTQRISLLDREGVQVERFDGLDRPLEPIAARTKQEIARSAAGP
jgi:protein SCO1/2